MTLAPVYRTATENIVTYGYNDITTGMSRVDLFAGNMCSGARVSGANHLSATGVLSNVAFYSQYPKMSLAVNNATTGVKEFDMEFNTPRTYLGTTIIQIPVIGAPTGGGIANYWYNIDLRKVDASGTETSLLSGATDSYKIGASVTCGAILVWGGDLPETTFTKGEKLRLWVWARHTGQGGSFWLIADPKNRTQSDQAKPLATSQLIVQIPEKLDL